MKHAPIAIIILLVAAAAVWGVWLSRIRVAAQIPNSTSPTAMIPPIKKASNPSPPAFFLTSSQWQEFSLDRQRILASNAALAAEHKEVIDSLDKQQQGLEAAMVKADPAVAPIIAKLESIRKGLRPGAASATSVPTLTPAEWQQIRTARTAALKANSNFSSSAIQLAARMRDFQHRLDQAVMQADPKTAVIIARIENGFDRPPSLPRPPGTSPSPTLSTVH